MSYFKTVIKGQKKRMPQWHPSSMLVWSKKIKLPVYYPCFDRISPNWRKTLDYDYLDLSMILKNHVDFGTTGSRVRWAD